MHKTQLTCSISFSPTNVMHYDNLRLQLRSRKSGREGERERGREGERERERERERRREREEGGRERGREGVNEGDGRRG